LSEDLDHHDDASGSKLPAPSYLHSTVPNPSTAIPDGDVAAPALQWLQLPWATQLTCSLTFKKALADIFTRVHDFIRRAVRAGNYGTLKC